jgi:hypothetical protein
MIRETLANEQITIPFPQRVLHIARDVAPVVGLPVTEPN